MCLKTQEKPAFDSEALLDSFEGDTEFVAGLMTTFVAGTVEYPELFESAGDYAKISALAHTLKGTAANVMCNPLSRVAGDLELYTKQKRVFKPRVKRKIRSVLFELDRVVTEVKSIYG